MDLLARLKLLTKLAKQELEVFYKSLKKSLIVGKFDLMSTFVRDLFLI